MLDWIGHHGDIAHWGLGFEHTGPVEVEGVGSFPASGEIWNTATEYRIVAKYANGMKIPNAKNGYRYDIKMSFRSSWEANYARILKFNDDPIIYEEKRYVLYGYTFNIVVVCWLLK